MRPLLLLQLVLVAFLCLSPNRAFAQSQAQMNIEAGERLNRADAELNKVYQATLKKNATDKRFIADLKEAQRAWLRFVEFHMKTLFPLNEGDNPREVYGSVYPTEYAEAKTELVLQRMKQLKSMAP